MLGALCQPFGQRAEIVKKLYKKIEENEIVRTYFLYGLSLNLLSLELFTKLYSDNQNLVN